MRVCFFCRTRDRADLDRVGFYREDIQLLKDLGHDVTVATRYSEIPNSTELIFAWWWTWSFLALLKSWRLGVPLIVTGVFDYATPPRGKRMCYLDRPWWQKFLMRLPLRFADANVFISDYEFKQIPSHFEVRNPKMIPCSVDLETHKARGSGDSATQPFFLNVAWSGGYNMHRKCLKEIVEGFILAAKKSPSIRLKMAGKQGEFHKDLVELAERSGVVDRIDFLGPISQKEKVRLMQECTAYLQPTRFEGFGLAIAEAMACEALVITSANSAVTEVVGPCGLFVDPEDPNEIADAVLKVAASPGAYETLRVQAGKRIATLYSQKRRREEVGALIQSLLVRAQK